MRSLQRVQRRTYSTIPLTQTDSAFVANLVHSKAEFRRELDILKRSLQVEEEDAGVFNPVEEFDAMIPLDQHLVPLDPILNEPLLGPHHGREESANSGLVLSPPPRGDIYTMPASLSGMGNRSVMASSATMTTPERLNHLEFTAEQIDGCFDL